MKRIRRLNGHRPSSTEMLRALHGQEMFETRIVREIKQAIKQQWELVTTIRGQAEAKGWTPNLKQKQRQARLSVDSLAARMDNMSTATLTRRLREHGMETPGDLIRSVRIEEAERLLVSTQLSVPEVGRRAGYNDAKSFSRSFLKATGKLPSEFRKEARRGLKRRDATPSA